ncbi:Na+/H+ antiporter NhaA [Terripilifer ovatus]|uniref:Na+/H+ antiporter NhaA n=1 Tax=Terripilifer ovatus TaxID=3032367 RepID=UPI003AB97908
MHRRAGALRTFLKSEAAGGVILMMAAVLAMIVANSALAPMYFSTLQAKLAGLSVLHWINDALMAIFFLLVGLEIKREFVGGELATWPKRALPGVAAAGGMILPALIYAAINMHTPATLRGWAIPAATDIAFALGVLALLGSRAPVSLKIFLAALAILDDLGAVVIIAIFYTADLSLPALAGVAVTTAVLVALNLTGAKRLVVYLALGVVLWIFMHESGVHATLAGVVLALTIPGREDQIGEDKKSPLQELEHLLHVPVAFFIVPIFGFANAGVSLAGASLSQLTHPVTLGIAAGLFVGKQLGVFFFTRLALATRLAEPPAGASTVQIYGVSILCGIGFTMSLFIGLLAFPNAPDLEAAVKIGVLLGSITSGLVGAGILIAAGGSAKRSLGV